MDAVTGIKETETVEDVSDEMRKIFSDNEQFLLDKGELVEENIKPWNQMKQKMDDVVNWEITGSHVEGRDIWGSRWNGEWTKTLNNEVLVEEIVLRLIKDDVESENVHIFKASKDDKQLHLKVDSTIGRENNAGYSWEATNLGNLG